MKAAERSLVYAVTIGSMLEWYEVYLYIYWTPILTNTFFHLAGTVAELANLVLVLIVGLVSRPFGGLLFGYIGDKYGRKTSLLLSIVLLSVPSFLTAVMPTFASWSLFFIIYIGIMKFIQGIPAGGELPGAMCLLAEGASPERKRYLCSFALVGPQIGQILSMVQCLIFQEYCSQDFLIEWGWRISFFVGGLIGLFGYFLRKKLDESHAFLHIKQERRVLTNPVKATFKGHKKKIALGFFISVFEVVGFYLLAFFFVEHAHKLFGLSSGQNILMNIMLLTPLTILLPFIGKLGDKYANKPLYVLSAFGIILLSLPFYLSINSSQNIISLVLLGAITLFFSIQFALLPTLLVELYPTTVRFTSIGFSFNVCDSVIGGLSPFLAIFLIQQLNNPGAFVMIYPITALIFLISIFFVKKQSPILE